jgi:hypothetical protein
MAQINFTPGATTVNANALISTSVHPAELPSLPGGLYPLRMALWETDEYRIAKGWPVVVPPQEIRAKALVSATGEVLAARPEPRALSTGATVRWIADSDAYSVTDLQWWPIEGESVVWETTPDYAPTFINEYEYERDEFVYFQDALNFDADSAEHMWTDLNPVLGGSTGYSVVMVAAMNSVYGNHLQSPYAGLWSVQEITDDGWVELSLQGHSLYLETEQSARAKALDISPLISGTAPFLLAMVVSRPYTTIYAAAGPSSITKAVLNVGNKVSSLNGAVVLGRSHGDLLHTADMALLDIGMFANQLTPAQVRDQFAALSSVYGGDK